MREGEGKDGGEERGREGGMVGEGRGGEGLAGSNEGVGGREKFPGISGHDHATRHEREVFYLATLSPQRIWYNGL